MKLRMQVGLGPGHTVLDGDRAPLPKAAQPLNFRPISIVAKRWGGVKMALGTEVCLSAGDSVFDGDSAPSPKGGGAPQIFGPCLLWSNGWMDQDGTWHGGAWALMVQATLC